MHHYFPLNFSQPFENVKTTKDYTQPGSGQALAPGLQFAQPVVKRWCVLQIRESSFPV